MSGDAGRSAGSFSRPATVQARTSPRPLGQVQSLTDGQIIRIDARVRLDEHGDRTVGVRGDSFQGTPARTVYISVASIAPIGVA
jgi:hypothetical protein